MLVRQSQIEAFRAAAWRPFEEEMIHHLRQFNPRHFAVVGEAGMRQAIQHGLKNAVNFGFSCKGPLRLFLEFMLMFGSDFHSDATYSWAGVVLRRSAVPEMHRAEELFHLARQYSEVVGGPGLGFEKEALSRARSIRWGDLSNQGDDYALAGLSLLTRVYPEKVAYVGREELQRSILKAGQCSDQHEVRSPQGKLLFVMLAFSLGQGFASDPLYPWISNTLRASIADPEKRAERLHAKAKLYLDAVLANLGIEDR
ncbi:hypothetical protein DYQ86_11595 [Acidobacteria bacterium AB60]|nr:hypothetical protein DYQ86_11595 [Acidobacteria bacterium AB60]